MLKIALIIGLLLFGLIYDLGGVAGQQRLGFWYWVDPGAFGEGYLVDGPVGRFVSHLPAVVVGLSWFTSATQVRILLRLC
jgi:yeast amino acid transporter